ncbi:MAG: NAD-dependent epimerase/dehydratase [uncultured bacterium]|nr:MAG: NAD-dependent epimerase/dehydratase [uncultured bacterium]
MNILITGGTGFIGSHLTRELHKMNHRIILLKRSFSDTWRIDDIMDSLVTYDLDKIIDLENIFSKNKIDLIIHLAGLHIRHHSTIKEIEEMNNANINFPIKLLDIAVRFQVKGFINTGTFSEYKLTVKPASEKDEIKPYNYYSATKSVFENLLKFYTFNKNIRGLSLRLFSPYGEKDNNKIIPLIIKSFISGKVINLTKGGQRLSFTYISDIVNAYIKSIDYIFSSKYNRYEEFNIGAVENYSIKKIIKIIEKISHKENKVTLGILPYHEHELMFGLCNNSKAGSFLHWDSKIGIIKGLKKTYNYYLNESKNS